MKEAIQLNENIINEAVGVVASLDHRQRTAKLVSYLIQDSQSRKFADPNFISKRPRILCELAESSTFSKRALNRFVGYLDKNRDFEGMDRFLNPFLVSLKINYRKEVRNYGKTRNARNDAI